MSIIRSLWKSRFEIKKIPNWLCPTCNKGRLTATENDFTIEETTESKKFHHHEDFDANWVKCNFNGVLLCINPECEERIFVIGNVRYEDKMTYSNLTNDYTYITKTYLYPKLFLPALNIFTIEQFSLKEKIIDAIEKSFFIFWSDPSACANKIRNVIELILDEFKIKKAELTKAKKRRKVSLHERIQNFKQIHQEAADFLMAIKWIGNSGSHSNQELTNDDLLDGLDILKLVITKLYEKDTIRIKKLSKTINRRKGPLKKR